MSVSADDPQQFLTVARNYLDENNRHEAIHFLRTALSLDPENVQARLLLGETLLRVDDIDGGLTELEAVYAADPKLGETAYVAALVAKGRALLAGHEETAALGLCRKALEISPDDSAAYQLYISLQVRRADVALLRNDLEGASESYRLAGDISKADQVHTLFRWQKQADLEAKARAMEMEERWEEAIGLYETLLSSAMDRDIKESWKTAIEHCREEAELAEIFDAGFMAFEYEDWAEAQSHFLALINRRPDYHRKGHYVTSLLDHAVRADTFDFITPLPIFSPLKISPALISVENASRVVRLARWGLGKPRDLMYTPDDQYLAVSTTIGVYFFYKNRNEIARIFDADAQVTALAMSQDSALLATGFEDGTIWIWRTADGAMSRKLRGHARRIADLAFYPDGTALVSGADDGTVRLWGVPDGRMLRVLQSQLPRVTGIDISPNGTQLAISAGDQKIRLQSLAGSEPSGILESEFSLNKPVFAPDGRFLSAGTQEGPVVIWDLSRKRASRLVGLKSPVRALSFSSKSQHLAAGDQDGNLFQWDVDSPAIARPVGEPLGALRGLAHSASGSFLAACAGDNLVRVWDLEPAQLVQTLNEFSAGVLKVHVSAGRNFILSAMEDGSIRLWNLADGRESGVLAENIIPGLMDSPPRGEIAAAVSHNQELLIWRTNPYVLRIKIPLKGESSALAFSPDGGRIAVGSRKGFIQVWSPDTSELQYSLEGHQGPVTQICYSPEGTRIASFGSDSTLRLWRSGDGHLIEVHEEIGSEVVSASFSPDGKHLVCGTLDGAIMRWRTGKGLEFEKQYQGHASAIRSLSHSPDSDILATGLLDGTVRLWQVSSETLLQTLTGHADVVSGLAFSHDGSLLFSGGGDGIIRVWGVVGR